MGVMYCWFHVYRPVGPDAKPELALTPAQQLQARQFVVDMRASKPIGIIDAYYDGRGQALCPAATGISHHISPWGDIEPCPIVQFAKESIHDDRPAAREVRASRSFCRISGRWPPRPRAAASCWSGPTWCSELAIKHGARDTTARKTALIELEAMQPRGSQYQPGHEIPEKSWAYRFIKKHWFNDFGAYGGQHE